MTTFLLNDTLIRTDAPKGMSLLNFIRNEAGLKGTKSGCKEGDCGACTVLEGTLKEGQVIYKSIVSCLTPLGNVQGKHIVTIEGLNNDELTPIQQAMVENAATQCGFCTPGFVVSLTGYSLSGKAGNEKEAIASIAGNICRCTGYKSIEKAALNLAALLKSKDQAQPIEWLIDQHFIPGYFKEIKERLESIAPATSPASKPDQIIGGGTDLMVQIPEKVKVSALHLTHTDNTLKTITRKNDKLIIGGAVTVNMLLENEYFTQSFPESKQWFRLISSEQIRNTATLAGNFVNASPIGDMSIFFLALDTNILLNDSGKTRTLPLKEFFLDYKKLNKQKEEIIEAIEIEIPGADSHFNFEKVSKRLHLDIASVNSAMKIETEGNIIRHASLSAGGIAPVPKFLQQTSEFLTGKILSYETLTEAISIAEKEATPIDDIRGSAAYKKLLLRQLILAHFMKMFPQLMNEETLLNFTA